MKSRRRIIIIELFIIADDFTGALDTAVQFTKVGIKTLVTTQHDICFETIDNDIQALVLNAETRHLAPNEAYRIVYAASVLASTAGVLNIYKKTDSALRGNIGSELKALIDSTGRKSLIFIPAFPKTGRVTHKGTHYIDGIPVHQSVFGKDPFEPVTCSYLPDIIHRQVDITVQVIEPEEINNINENGEKHIVIVNADSDDMLLTSAKKVKKMKTPRILAGSAGFAAMVPIFLSKTKMRESIDYPRSEYIVVISGSVNPITTKQTVYATAHGFESFVLSPQQKMDETFAKSEICKTLMTELIANSKTKLLIIQAVASIEDMQATDELANKTGITLEHQREMIAQTLGGITLVFEELLSDVIFMIIGGDTLVSFLQQAECHSVQPIKEIAPGVVFSGIEHDGREMHVVSKSGGFGTEDIIVKVAQQLQKYDKKEVFYHEE